MYLEELLRSSQRWLGVLLIVAGLSACQAPAPIPSAATPSDASAQPTTPVGQPTASSSGALPTAPATAPADAGSLATAFAGLDKMVSRALGLPVTAGDAVFNDFITGGEVSSYRLIAKGTGVDLQDMGTVSGKIERMFADLTWEQDVTYGATGVASSTIGYRQGKKLCVVMVVLSPSNDADCPKGTPIMNCNLRPEQMLFTITLECMLRE